MKNLILLCAFILGVAISSNAQKSFTEIDAKTFEKLSRVTNPSKDKTGGTYSNLTGHTFKKVAMVSYILTVESDNKKYGGLRMANSGTDFGAGYVVNKMLEISGNEIKQSFEKEGVDLLFYEDFSSGQKQVLDKIATLDWVPGQDQLEMLASIKENMVTKGLGQDVGGPATNYQYLSAEVVLTKKGYEFYGQLIKDLGVDAIMLLESGSSMDGGKAYAYSKLAVKILGTNPISMENGEQMHKGMALKIFKNNYWPAVPYAELTLAMKKPIPMLDLKKGEITGEHFDGIGEFFSYFAAPMMSSFNSRTVGKKKK